MWEDNLIQSLREEYNPFRLRESNDWITQMKNCLTDQFKDSSPMIGGVYTEITDAFDKAACVTRYTGDNKTKPYEYASISKEESKSLAAYAVQNVKSNGNEIHVNMAYLDDKGNIQSASKPEDATIFLYFIKMSYVLKNMAAFCKKHNITESIYMPKDCEDSNTRLIRSYFASAMRTFAGKSIFMFLDSGYHDTDDVYVYIQGERSFKRLSSISSFNKTDLQIAFKDDKNVILKRDEVYAKLQQHAPLKVDNAPVEYVKTAVNTYFKFNPKDPADPISAKVNIIGFAIPLNPNQVAQIQKFAHTSNTLMRTTLIANDSRKGLGGSVMLDAITNAFSQQKETNWSTI